MAEPTYKIRCILKKSASGVTKASYCTLGAILKFDSDESPHCVYNEIVAVRLAQTCHIPLADGVLTATSDGPSYASLELASPGIGLPDMLESQIPSVAAAYPDAVAALVVFDVLIGNRDRSRNVKASLTTPHIPIFRAFDHSHALLTIHETPGKSIAALETSDLIATQHPFYGFVSRGLLNTWVARIASTPGTLIKECARFGRPFRGVDERMQEQLADALVMRAQNLGGVVTRHRAVIKPQP